MRPAAILSLVRERGATLWPIQRSTKRFVEGDENGIAEYAAVAAGLDVGPRPR